MIELKQVFQAEDGTVFNSKAEAVDYMRRPQIRAALMAVTEANEELSDWLLENREDIEATFGVGTVKRVTKSERNRLIKALETVVEEMGDNPKVKFLVDHHEDLATSFKWPNQRRLSGEDKDAAIKQELLGLTDGDENLAEWISTTREKLAEAFEAGKPKREVSPKAKAALAEYQAKKRAEKEAAEKAAE